VHPNDVNQHDYAKEQVESARFGLGVFLMFIFTIGRSVQLFSRVPGTSGPGLVLASLFSILTQVWYYQMNVDASGSSDSIAIEWVFLVQIVWFLYCVCATIWNQLPGYGLDLTDIGVGIFRRWLPNSENSVVGFVSDMALAIGLACFFFAFDSPILGGWYRAMVVWLLIGHVWLKARNDIELQRIKNARSRAEYWSNRFNRGQ